MKNYWVIAPYFADPMDPNSVIFDQVWSYDLKHNTIAIGWNQLGDISGISKHELILAFQTPPSDGLPPTSPGSKTHKVNMIWVFYHEIKLGDIIIARKGRKKIVRIGTVIGMPSYDQEKGIERVGKSDIYYYYPNFLPVKWENKTKHFTDIVFSMNTLYPISNDKAFSLLNE
jgi:predicted Mrr-cat superfamily restriction endonuclease